MKHIYLILLSLLACQITYSETEPNNTAVQANTLALNGNDAGKIDAAGDVDWWKVTTAADGKLNIKLSTPSAKSIGIYLYDNNSTTLLTSGTTAGALTITKSDLAPGTYYIKVACVSAADTASYTISNSVQLPAQANDAEPNDSRNQALNLPRNSSTTGHLGYYYNNKRDTADWYKITTNRDGRLDISLTPVSGTNTWLYLYDNDGATLLNSNDSAAAFTLSTDGLATGTYYIKLKCATASKYTPYILSDTLITVVQNSDTEPNNTLAQAVELPLNTTKTGRIGYYYNNNRDTVDWYKLITNNDGKLNVKFTPVNGSNTWLYLYDSNGNTVLNSGDSTAAFTLSTDGLAAGTYFLKVKSANSLGFTPYIISNGLDTLAQANDAEPNNSRAQAQVLALNGTQSGHIGFYSNNKRDTSDWYKITTNKDGRLDFTLTPANGSDTWLYLYDNNGTTILASKDSNIAFAVSRDGLAIGTYYIKIISSATSGFGAYTLTNNLVSPSQGHDSEPNNTFAQAITLTANSSKAGHVGYYYNNKRDTSDWYKITTTVDSKLKLRLSPANGQAVRLWLYAGNGTSLIDSVSSGSVFFLTADAVEDDVYYVRVSCRNSSGFAPYTLTDSVLTPTKDTIILPQNYRITDTLQTQGDEDWFKLTTNADGILKLTLTPVSSKYVWVYLYDKNATTELASKYDDKSFSLSRNDLAAGTYFVKVRSYYASDTTRYLLADTLTAPAQANDVEPNNIKEQAITLNVNSRATGNIGYYQNNRRDTADWYKITTKADGRLNLTLNPVNGTHVWVYLFDNNGTSLLESKYDDKPFTLNRPDLAAGTYYVRVNCYYSYGYTPYVLSDTLVPPAEANDAEPNNAAAQAVTLNVNSSKTGHIGYYYNLKRDTTDWYKITTKAEGILSLHLNPVNGSNVWVYLFDNNGTTLLESGYNDKPFKISRSDLAAGTYYVKVNCYYSNQFTPYVLSDTLVSPVQANDKEPNNTLAQAIPLNPNSATTGHVGYYYNLKRDTADWYKITTTADGILSLGLTPVNGSNAWIYLYDNNGTTLLESGYNDKPFKISRSDLAAGTYYVRINCYYSNQYTPYVFTDTLIRPAESNDTEPNNTQAQAITLSPNSTKTGHIGYFYNGKRDTADWYKITIPQDGLLKLKLTPANGSYLWAYLYDNNGTRLLNSTYNNTPFVQNTDGLAAGTYYVKINCYYNNHYTPYTLTDSLLTYAYAADTEPNAKPYQGKIIAENSTVTGHATFYYNLAKDSVDWWKLNYTGNGNLQFKFNLEPNKNGSIPYTWFYVYKDTSAGPVYSNYFNTASNTINLTSLSKGTYYIRISTYYISDFVAYSITNTLPPAAPITSARPETLEDGLAALNNKITVYPNPVSNQLHVQLSGRQANLSSLILRDVNGKQVWNRSNLAESQGSVLKINVSRFPAGSYFLQMTDSKGKSTVRKIIIEK